MKLKGVKTLNKNIQKAFSRATGIDIPMKMDKDFCYLSDKQKIGYSILISEQADRNFKAFIKNFFGLEIQSDTELFCLSVLHEVGHFLTYDDIAEGDYLLSQQEKGKITKALQKDPNNDQIYSRYFFLPVEIIATMWAVDFIENNPIIFQQLVTQVQKKLNTFYKKNLTKED